jgi:hypothetical protein
MKILFCIFQKLNFYSDCKGFVQNACAPASAKLPKPNAGWRDGFSLVPSIPVGSADKRKVGALVQSGITTCWSRILYWTLISLVVWFFKVKRKKRLMQAG